MHNLNSSVDLRWSEMYRAGQRRSGAVTDRADRNQSYTDSSRINKMAESVALNNQQPILDRSMQSNLPRPQPLSPYHRYAKQPRFTHQSIQQQGQPILNPYQQLQAYVSSVDLNNNGVNNNNNNKASYEREIVDGAPGHLHRRANSYGQDVQSRLSNTNTNRQNLQSELEKATRDARASSVLNQGGLGKIQPILTNYSNLSPTPISNQIGSPRKLAHGSSIKYQQNPNLMGHSMIDAHHNPQPLIHPHRLPPSNLAHLSQLSLLPLNMTPINYNTPLNVSANTPTPQSPRSLQSPTPSQITPPQPLNTHDRPTNIFISQLRPKQEWKPRIKLFGGSQMAGAKMS